jgi:hypothetical protein
MNQRKTLWNLTQIDEIIIQHCLLLWNVINFHEISLNLINFVIFLFNSVKEWNIFAKFGKFDLKILLDICYISLTFVHAMQNEQKNWHLLLRPLQKFGGKV